jgi:hypothetical protein
MKMLTPIAIFAVTFAAVPSIASAAVFGTSRTSVSASSSSASSSSGGSSSASGVATASVINGVGTVFVDGSATGNGVSNVGASANGVTTFGTFTGSGVGGGGPVDWMAWIANFIGNSGVRR